VLCGADLTELRVDEDEDARELEALCKHRQRPRGGA
jgi:hypothetical protein